MSTNYKFLTKNDEGIILIKMLLLVMMSEKGNVDKLNHDLMLEIDNIVAREVQKAADVPADMAAQIKAAAMTGTIAKGYDEKFAEMAKAHKNNEPEKNDNAS